MTAGEAFRLALSATTLAEIAIAGPGVSANTPAPTEP